jgi:hypothetical protein
VRRLLCIVPTQPTSPGVAIGSVVAAATTGALVAMGHRLGSAVLPFAAISAAGWHRTLTATDTGLVLAGLVFHVTFAFVWSFLFVFLVRRARWRDVAGAVVIAVGELVTSWIVTLSTGAGVASVLQLGDRIVFALVYALALVVGMRFALPLLRNAR